jgi:hypothetical protein
MDRIPSDPREALRYLKARYPKLDRERLREVFVAAIIGDRALESAVIRKAADDLVAEEL